MTKLQRLPIGDSSFESIREGNWLYVDKTRHIFQMVDEGKYYFMSRPRRFGKSLTVSTLRCLFQGRKELFDGLWIKEHTDWEWKKYPLILIDFNGISHDTPENLKSGLMTHLKDIEDVYDISVEEPLLKEHFRKVIRSLYEKMNMPVVILIDEYDKPLIDHLGRGEEALDIAKQNRDILKYFLGVLKDGDVSSVLRFVFITGVSKFSRVSIFSELNNLQDLTMYEPYADMLGYTQNELETYFTPYIHLLSQHTGCSESEMIAKLERYYNGYRFSKRDIRVYNPFSVMSALKQKDFKNYWFETGTPTFLINLLKETNWYLPKIENMKSGESVFSTYEIDNLKPEALLFQTGYVTIKDINERLYTFRYPNQEVKTSFLELLFYSYAEGIRDSSQFLLLAGYLQQEEFNAFFETVSSIFASIPYMLEIKRDEAYFHTVFYLIVCASGVNAHSEVLTCIGRIDLLIEFSDKIFIIEFKCNQSAETALAQIRDKAYDQPYKQKGKKIILMGINFDTEKRTLAEWKIVNVSS
ncbi:MAG: ATP-binding protein [Desulfobacterales bacterium]|nr:ATP-binding protein [Desulfobacterales bacterium]